MIDHILSFADEPAAHTALDPLGYGFNGTSWDGSRTMPNINIITSEAVWNNTDPMNPVLVTPQAHVAGWFIAIALPAFDATLQALPNNALRFASDRDKGGTGPQCVIYLASDIEPAILVGSRVSQVFAGSSYIFGI